MPQLTSTQSSLILSVAKGNSLVVRNRSGVETVTGSSVSREDATAVLGSGTYVYGPQTSASTLTISTTGVCDYDIVAGDPTPAVEPARVVRNAATGAPASLIDPATGQAVSVGGIDILKAKIRATVARARVSNPLENTPWFKPKPWANGALFRAGIVAASTDNVNAFTCMAASANAWQAASATGSGPTGTPADWVAEAGNLLQWEWIGPLRGQDTYANWSSLVTYGLTATLLAQFSNPQSYWPGPSNSWVSFTGGFLNFRNATQPYFPDVYRSQDKLSGSSPNALMTINTDADRIALLADENVYGGGSPAVWEINGTRVMDGLATAQPQQYNPGGVSVDLSYWGKGKAKKVRIRASAAFLSQLATRIIVEKTASIWPDAAPTWRMAFEGDSLTYGGNGSPIFPGLQWPDIVANYLGCEDYMNNAVGGTGFTNAGAATKFIERINNIIAYAPDVVVIGGNHNDSGAGVSSATRQAAVATYLRTLRAGLQTYTPIIVLGNDRLRGEAFAPGSDQYVAESDLQAACATVNDPFVYFVPNILGTNQRIRGLGHATSPVGDGNADICYSAITGVLQNADSHPIQRGYTVIGQRNARVIEAILTA